MDIEEKRRRSREAMRKWREAHPNYYSKEYWKEFHIKHKEKINLRDRQERLNNPAKAMLQAARTRAKRKGIIFNLLIEDIVIPEFCPVLGTTTNE